MTYFTGHNPPKHTKLASVGIIKPAEPHSCLLLYMTVHARSSLINRTGAELNRRSYACVD